MKKLPITLAIAITAGSTHAVDVLYSSEDFEGGTPNYTITGGGPEYILNQLDSSDVALAGTDYERGSPSRQGVFANNSIPGTIINEPTGQHGFVSQSQNRQLKLRNPMTLVTDGVQSLDITFEAMLYAFDEAGNDFSPTFDDAGAVFYSELGDFTDAVMIATFATADMTEPTVFPELPDSVLGHTTLVEDTWSTVSLSLSNTDVTFSDTAKIRFNKLPSTGTNLMVFFDNITVTGVPGSAPAATFMATITPAVDPATGYDIQWPSQSGATYTLFTSPDLDTPIAGWTVVEADIAPTPPQNTYNVPANEPRRFYAVEEVNP